MKPISANLTQIWLSGVFALSAISSMAGEAQAVTPFLPEPEEIQAALEAAPPHLRDGAGVYALEKSGYRRVRASHNGFNCLIEREYAGLFSPECFDAEGSKAFLPVILYRAEQGAKGVTPREVEQAVAARYQRHEFLPPARVGICYMLSARNVVLLDRATGRVGPVGPHLMFYAPNSSSADFGATADMAAHFIIADQGTPGAMIVVPVATPGDTHAHQ